MQCQDPKIAILKYKINEVKRQRNLELLKETRIRLIDSKDPSSFKYNQFSPKHFSSLNPDKQQRRLQNAYSTYQFNAIGTGNESMKQNSTLSTNLNTQVINSKFLSSRFASQISESSARKFLRKYTSSDSIKNNILKRDNDALSSKVTSITHDLMKDINQFRYLVKMEQNKHHKSQIFDLNIQNYNEIKQKNYEDLEKQLKKKSDVSVKNKIENDVQIVQSIEKQKRLFKIEMAQRQSLIQMGSLQADVIQKRDRVHSAKILKDCHRFDVYTKAEEFFNKNINQLQKKLYWKDEKFRKSSEFNSHQFSEKKLMLFQQLQEKGERARNTYKTQNEELGSYEVRMNQLMSLENNIQQKSLFANNLKLRTMSRLQSANKIKVQKGLSAYLAYKDSLKESISFLSFKEGKSAEFVNKIKKASAIQIKRKQDLDQLKKETTIQNSLVKMRKDQFETEMTEQKIQEHQRAFLESCSMKSDLEKQRLKFQFDLERRKIEIRETYDRMQVWNCWDEKVLDQVFQRVPGTSIDSVLAKIMTFICSIDACGKFFSCKKTLKEHERTHTGERPYSCSQCDTTFAQYSSLQKHQRVHDKMKPYQCKEIGCALSFSQISNLIRHSRIHTGEKPYICEECSKSFASGSNLKQHMQVHNNDEKRLQFECTVQDCDRAFLYISSLKKHLQLVHAIEDKAQILIQYTGKQDINTDQNAKILKSQEESKLSSIQSNKSSIKLQQNSMLQKRDKPDSNQHIVNNGIESKPSDLGIKFSSCKKQKVQLGNALENQERSGNQQHENTKIEVVQNSNISEQIKKSTQIKHQISQSNLKKEIYGKKHLQDYNNSLSLQNGSNYQTALSSITPQSNLSQKISPNIARIQEQQFFLQQQQLQPLQIQQNNSSGNIIYNNPQLIQQMSQVNNVPLNSNSFPIQNPQNINYNQQYFQPQQNYLQPQQQQIQQQQYFNGLNQQLNNINMPHLQQQNINDEPPQQFALKQLLNQYAQTANYLASLLNNQQQNNSSTQSMPYNEIPLQNQNLMQLNYFNPQSLISNGNQLVTQQQQQYQLGMSIDQGLVKGGVAQSECQISLKDYQRIPCNQRQQSQQSVIYDKDSLKINLMANQKVDNSMCSPQIKQQIQQNYADLNENDKSFDTDSEKNQKEKDEILDIAQQFLNCSKPFQYKSLALTDFKPKKDEYIQSEKERVQEKLNEMREKEYSDDYLHHNDDSSDTDNQMDYQFTSGKGGKGFGKGKGMFGIPKFQLKPQERIKSIQCQYDELQDIQNDQIQKELAKAQNLEQQQIQGAQKLNAIQLQIFKQSKENFIKLFKKLPCIKTCINKVSVQDQALNDSKKNTITHQSLKLNYGENDFQEMSKVQNSTQSCRFICDSDKICPEFLPVNCDDYYDRKCDCSNYCKKMLKLMGHFISDKAQINEIEDLCQAKNQDVEIFDEKSQHCH